MPKLMRVAFFLFALALLPLQGWATNGLSSSGDCPTLSAQQTGPCAGKPLHSSDNHGHGACCQAQTLGTTATSSTVPAIVTPQTSRHEVRYTSFVPPADAPPPRS
jgi:hypothetical protein